MEPNIDKTSILEGVLNNLFECMNDKDESVRHAVESSLIRIVEKRPDDSLNILSEYKHKHPKLNEAIISTLLRVVESVTTSGVEIINDETIDKVIALAIGELTKLNEHCPAIQKPAMEILVAIGRNHCDKVMQKLIAHTPEGGVAHFMVMHCMGALAMANVAGVTPFIKMILATTLPNLGSIKLDHVKQAHAFAIGHFSEALMENSSDHPPSPPPQAETGEEEEEEQPTKSCTTEISVAYDFFLTHWLHSREPKVCVDILQALSSMYPLLPDDKVHEQSTKLVSSLLNLYRRSIDRNAITQFLGSVLKTTINVDPKSLDSIADALVTSLFDLVCVYPDYEKPQTVKGHYEVLRCYSLLAEIYRQKILEMLRLHMRNNNERERIKALLVLTHLINTLKNLAPSEVADHVAILNQMILTEKAIKMKMTMLKMIVALAQKDLLAEKELVWFITRHCCRYTKINTEFGTIEEHNEFCQACHNSLSMLSSTVGTIDQLLKRELLNYLVQLDYTDISSTIMKCLSSLFTKDTKIELEVETSSSASSNSEEEEPRNSKTPLPSPEAVFSRCLALMGNFREVQRISHVLSFLKSYATVLSDDLKPLWEVKIPELLLCNGREKLFLDHLFGYIAESIHCLEKDANFAERLVNKMSDQLYLYPINTPASEFFIPNLTAERGMLLKSIGLCLCYVTENQTIEAKIDLIINAAKQEKLEKHAPNSDYEHKLVDASKALGFISKTHLNIVLRRLSSLANVGSRKTSVGFFSNFIKDSAKESENYKMHLLVFETYGHIIENANPVESLKDIDDTMMTFLMKQLNDAKDQTMKKVILNTILSICNQFQKTKDLGYDLKSRNDILKQLLEIRIDSPFDNLPLFPTILRLATTLIKIECDGTIDVNTFLDISCRNFFSCAQNLKTKFDSIEDDQRNSFLAQHLNQSLPELNSLVKVMIEKNPSPSCLDDVVSILEYWIKDKNSEVRICTGHVLNSSLEVYIKSMKIGCEAPSKFNQTGQMLGKIVPRCIDSNATVRQTSVDILQKILEISCIYETLTIADGSAEWIKGLENIRDLIITDDPKEIYQLAGDIARIIATRISNFQYLQFCKTLLYCLNDPEQSSAIGASVVLKFFIQQKGAELFHAIPDLVMESLHAVKHCEINRAKSGILKSLVALTKHHPKLVCHEMLAQPLPFEDCVLEFWQTVCIDLELTGTILDNFMTILGASCLYEPQENKDDRQKIATIQPFAIFCALKEIFPSQEIRTELKYKFPELFTVLLTSLATYTNLAPPTIPAKPAPTNAKGQPTNGKSKFGFVPNKDAVKMNPCQVVLEAFQALLINLEMEQICAVLAVCPHLSSSTDLNNFIGLLSPMAVALVNHFTITSSAMKQIVTCLSKYISSPYDGQRIAAIGLYSQLVPLRPFGEISSVIMLHLSSALSDPSPVVRGLCIQGFAFVGNLTEHDIEKYSETAISALLKGIDDFNSDCLINIPLESKRGLSRILQTLPGDRVESFHISLAIRIRPFFENSSSEIREAAILLFGDLCESKMETITDGSMTPNCSSEALREQLFANLISLLLHLSETDPVIVRACKVTLKKICALINATKVNEMAQKHLLEHYQLNYDVFIVNFVKVIGNDLKDHVQDFIESCIPFLKSYWTEIRGNAAIIIGILHNYLQVHNQHGEAVGHKLAILLRDEHPTVKQKAATALGYFFGDI